MKSPAAHSIHDRVLAFIADPDRDDFGELALAVFRHQFAHVEPYRRYCQARNASAESVCLWQQIPPVPVLAFKETELRCGPAERRFRSSGTMRGAEGRSVHAMPDVRLYRAAAIEGLRRFLFPGAPSMRLLSLVHTAAEQPESSLAQMIDWALQEFAAPGSRYAARGTHIDMDFAAETLSTSESEGTPLCLLATTAALIRFLDGCSERRWRFRLPHGSRLVDTGGAKGASRPLSRKGLLHAVWNTLAIPGYFCTNEYGMCELASQAYENVIANRFAGRFARRALVTPPWMRTRVLDPATLADAPPGERGLLCHYDLANAGTAMAVLTEDIGRTVADGFEILGRASGAETRGCSLVWDEKGSFFNS